MATTVEVIIQNGFAKSIAARADSFQVTDELIARVGQCLREVFQTIARENPYIIGQAYTVSFDGTGWPRPTNAMRVLMVKATVGTIANPVIASGTEIVVVPYDDQRFYEGTASLTELGQKFVSTGQAMDPSSGTLSIVVARAPEMPDAEDDTIDALIPSFFDDIFQQDIAGYLAAKDKRKDDSDFFYGMKDALIGQFVDWTMLQTYSLQQRFPIVSPPLASANRGRAQPEKGAE
jgi:hypothetical protein